jgi:uncharacterized lipoprotein YmbA
MKKTITLLSFVLLTACSSNEKQRDNFELNAELGKQTYEIELRREILKTDSVRDVKEVLKATDSAYFIEIKKTSKRLFK